MTKQDYCDALKQRGIKEVILTTAPTGDPRERPVPVLEVAGEDEEGHFKFTMANTDFTEGGL